MIIAHTFAGYIISDKLLKIVNHGSLSSNIFILSGMLGAIAPDIDLIYFYPIDNKQHHHHSYFTHLPISWLILLAISIICSKLKPSNFSLLFFIFTLNGLLHLLLDSMSGQIKWLLPFNNKSF